MIKAIGFDGPQHKDGSFIYLDSINSHYYHYEAERYTRVKEGPSDCFERVVNIFPNSYECDFICTPSHVTSVNHPQIAIKDYLHDNIELTESGHLTEQSKDFVLKRKSPSCLKYSGEWINPLLFTKANLEKLAPKRFFVVSHHLCHAAHGFFSADINDALVVTIDGGGIDLGNCGAICGDQTYSHWQIDSFCVWHFNKDGCSLLEKKSVYELNIGEAYNACTAYILGSVNSNIGGNQCGTIMAMAAMYSPYVHLDLANSLISNPNKAFIYNSLKETFGEKPSDDTSYSLAASFQLATEKLILGLISPYLSLSKNLVFSGGVALNSVMLGKYAASLIKEKSNIFVPPVPYDAGLSIGAVQYVLNQKNSYDAITKTKLMSPYLGKSYSKESVISTIEKFRNSIHIKNANLEEVCSLLTEQKIIAIYAGSSESGRRALGNRSILADPRNPSIKDIINEKVKHRQWYRPFAPVLLSKYVNEIFNANLHSPYMNLVGKFKGAYQNKYPGVVHLDGTGRLQTVANDDIYGESMIYKILCIMDNQHDCKVLLNTSFNDREPIVETPNDAISCFLRTNIDFLYYADFNILVKKI